jgi:hypothetical protein
MKSSNNKDPNKHELYDLYITQNLSKQQIRKLTKLGNKKLTDLLQKYGIKKSPDVINKNISKKLQGHEPTTKRKPLPRDKIIDVYKHHHKSPEQIAEMLNCSHGIIRRRLKEAGLEKSQKEQRKDRIIRSQEKYGVDHVSQTEEWKQRHYEAQKANNTFNTSQPEEYVNAILEKKFGKKNVVRQYKSELYPFKCDFYIKNLDLYIEYQGSWVHYHEPFNILNYRHLNQLREWKYRSQFSDYYKEAIKTWTIRDPIKRKIAKKNKLKWAEFFTVKDLLKWINS